MADLISTLEGKKYLDRDLVNALAMMFELEIESVRRIWNELRK